MKVLNIIENAYRGTLEEQDDTVVWLTHAMQGAGGDLDVLLCGNAVNYGVRSQDASGLSFGGLEQTRPPELAGDLSKLVSKHVGVFVVEDDLSDRGIDHEDLIEGLEIVPRNAIAGLLANYDQVWRW